MPKYPFTEKQKNLLKSIIPGLKNGTVKTHWLISYQGEKIIQILGLGDDGTLWLDFWAGVQASDFDVLVRQGLFNDWC